MPAHSAPAGTKAPYRYQAFGLSLRSDVPLAGLAPGFGTGTADVAIRMGRVPPAADEPRAGFGLSEIGPLLAIPGVGRFLILDGREIVVDPAEGASFRNVRLYLLGSALGAVLHQRGLLPLHANAIEIDGRAAAFLGHSGAGKSTLAAWFHDRGHRVLSDDVCVITDLQASAPLVQQGLARLRLQTGALERSGRAVADYEPSFDDYDKYDVPARVGDDFSPAPLHAAYLIDRELDGDEAIVPLRGTDALQSVVANTYRGSFVPMLGRTAEHLSQCVQLVRSVPVFRVSRQWGFDVMDEQNERLKSHFLSVGRRGAL